MAYSSVLLMAGGGVTINAIAQVQREEDPYPVIIAGGMLLVVLAFVDQWQDGLATALAGLYFLATMLTRGTSFFEWVSKLVSAK